MFLRTIALFALAGLPVWIATSPHLLADVGAEAADTETHERLRQARATQAATRARLRLLGQASACSQAPFVSYRRSDLEHDVVDQWYLASQLWADAVLLSVTALGFPADPDPMGSRQSWSEPSPFPGAAAARCHLDKGFVFLERFWDGDQGGYYARSDQTGARVGRDARYADDNALAGLALLAAAEAPIAARQQRRYLHAARRQAAFLAGSGLWDETFGGGFWWNTRKGDTHEGKPAQSNALAALFFARLYHATGAPAHREWALRTLRWMDAALYDPARQLYRWSVHYADPARRVGAVRSQRYFNYDQAIAIEAQILAARLGGDTDRLRRARDVGQALHTAFWGQARGGYNLEAGVEQVYASYAAWSSLGHLALYDLDRDPVWLAMARANVDALHAALRQPDGSYASRHYACRDRTAPGCASGQVRWVLDPTRDTAAQAWMQHLQAALALRVATSHLPAGWPVVPLKPATCLGPCAI